MEGCLGGLLPCAEKLLQHNFSSAGQTNYTERLRWGLLLKAVFRSLISISMLVDPLEMPCAKAAAS